MTLLRLDSSQNGSVIRGRRLQHAPAGRRSFVERRARRNILMVCSLYALPYRVMRCIAASDANVYVLGGPGSSGLRHSRYCKAFVSSARSEFGERDHALAHEINLCVRDFGIDMVVPGGAGATRALVANKDLVEAACFPLPGLEQFDLLNDKWNFTQLCIAQGIACPKSTHFADRAELMRSLERGALRFPSIAKPLGQDGGHGVLKLQHSDARSQFERIDYRPIILQEFIEGDDIGASVYCERGEIRSFIAHSLKSGIYRTFLDPRIVDAISRILGPLKADGVYNFDMRLTPGNEIYFLECNPRFYFKIALSMAAGINFVHLGLDAAANVPASLPHGTQVRRPWALALSLRKPWTITSLDIGLFLSLLKDPVSYVRESLRIDWDY
jgi:predicted ATP-grasp superfamily ATP-dependent carboligase